jgi:hypothetical protein
MMNRFGSIPLVTLAASVLFAAIAHADLAEFNADGWGNASLGGQRSALSLPTPKTLIRTAAKLRL